MNVEWRIHYNISIQDLIPWHMFYFLGRQRNAAQSKVHFVPDQLRELPTSPIHL
jgi:hypothetical protein